MLPIRPFQVDLETYKNFEQRFAAVGLGFERLNDSLEDEEESAKIICGEKRFSIAINTVDHEADIVEGGVWLLDDGTMNLTDDITSRLDTVLGEEPSGITHGAKQLLPDLRMTVCVFRALRIVTKITVWIFALVGVYFIATNLLG